MLELYWCLFAVLLLAWSSAAHSWIEQMSIIGSNGSFTGAYGYPRGYVARSDPGFSGFSDEWLIPQPETGRIRANASDLLCHPAQRTSNQTSKYPVLSVVPGTAIAMKYLENGHVSLPQNQKGKPQKGGTVFVFGTTEPHEDEKLIDVLQWTKDGSGGDRRGVLISTANFDDGRCYQLNSGEISTQRQQQFPNPFPDQTGSRNEQWCETDVILPTSLHVGSYTLYWVWDWPTASGQDPIYPTGKDEYYTTCSDIAVHADLTIGPVSNQLTQQDPQINAVSNYKSRTAIAPLPTELGPVAVNPSLSLPTPVVMSSSEVPMNVLGPAAVTTGRPDLSDSVPSPPFDGLLSAEPTSAVVTGQFGSKVQVLTALVTVIATLQPGQAGVVLQGQHVVTFVNPEMASATTTVVPPADRVRQHAAERRSARVRT